MVIQIHMAILRMDRDMQRIVYGRESWGIYWEIVSKSLRMERMEERSLLMIRIWKAVMVCVTLRRVWKPMHHWILLY